MDLSTLLFITAVRSIYVGNRMVDHRHAADITFAFVSTQIVGCTKFVLLIKEPSPCFWAL